MRPDKPCRIWGSSAVPQMLNCETKIRPTPPSGVVQSFCHRTAWLTRVWADITTSANAACRVWREHAGPAVPVRRIAAVQKLRQQRYRLLEGQSRRADEPCASCEQVAV